MFASEPSTTEQLDWAAIAAQVLRLTRRHARPEDAEDVAQEAMLRLWRTRASVSAARDQRAWIATLAINEVRRHAARRHHDETAFDDDVEVADWRAATSQVDRLDVVDRLRVLDPGDQLLMLLHYFGDLSLAEISRRNDMPLGTVKARLHRARSRLQGAGVQSSA